eukprot:CAMPEP_0185027230 /NCGR_PEP_ID=MMETSP1103-20130426/12022_1 /TAXON_ID=36769 /ORGANISM="Paraphysomonas bandaiensis, Strain Caron Lab Isolate" /LENGTH=239 /DNA_ID=CAMNT_0027561123 /DNA_START=76 /DNA_END=795 /DNA_ORIENTATION=-
MDLKELPNQVPRHIAVIMDGNRRYGREKHSDPLQGHWTGGQTLVDFVQWCMDDGIEILTVYAFSTENWNREQHEVTTLMMIISKYAESLQKEAISKNVRVNILATDLDRLPGNIRAKVRELESATRDCTGFVLNVCLSYGGRAEIAIACRDIAAAAVAGNISVQDISEDTIQRFLTTRSLPDPELLIRTSGEYRLSNFLLWQIAYTELVFIEKYWPEVTRSDLRNILVDYSKRSRRFGS